jgi:leucyl aminopeptidase
MTNDTSSKIRENIINIKIINKSGIIYNDENKILTFFYDSKSNSITIIFNISGLSNMEINRKIINIINISSIYNIKNFNINFNTNDSKIDINDIYKLISKFNDKFYTYYPKSTKNIILDEKYLDVYNILSNYKDIIMNPNKTTEMYKDYVINYVKDFQNYSYDIYKDDNKFPLCLAVNKGSTLPMYFIHIKPNKSYSNKKNIYLIGKAVIFDSGGMNLKKRMEDMKIDMTGSAIVLTVLNLLIYNNLDTNYNINLLIPIVENMIGNTATRPGTVIESYNGKTVEITDTDAEGRLCIADALNFINKDLIKTEEEKNNSIIIDIATLTGNTISITQCVSSICLYNKKGREYFKLLYNIGEDIGEYIDSLTLRDEYMIKTKSKVADIKNYTYGTNAGCVMGGMFLKYFTNDNIPWLHLDVASNTYKNEMANNYGIMLLFIFIKNLLKN